MSRKEKVFSPHTPLHPTLQIPTSNWFANRKIQFLYSDGQRNYYGVKDPDGVGNNDDFVVSKAVQMDLEQQHEFNRRAAKVAKEQENGI